jgi:formiminotetrahydrofolate cyclodeaminase
MSDTSRHSSIDEKEALKRATNVQVLEEPEADDRVIQAIALPKTSEPTSPLNGYMLFCTLVVGFGGLNWG